MKIWIQSVFILTFFLLAVLKGHELATLHLYYKNEAPLKLKSFQEAQSKVSKSDTDLLKLWESIMTGRSAPLSKIMKDKYKSLGLNHIFTPSGFHLSAVLFPFMKFMKGNTTQFIFLIIIGLGLWFLPGFAALKRMVFIKSSQKLLGLHTGFICALFLDICFGSFQNNSLSFTYSFLFLGIIYSGVRGLRLILWFFIGQILLAYFQQSEISLLLLIFSPFFNFLFSLLMPILFLMAIPLWGWQLKIGIFLLGITQKLVDFAAIQILKFPSFEVSVAILLLLLCLLTNRKKTFIALFFFLSSSLNTDHERAPAPGRFDYVPVGEKTKIISNEKQIVVYYKDGVCRVKLVRGIWYENCSPRRRSSIKKKIS